MESQPQNPEFRNIPENFHPCGFRYNAVILWLNFFFTIECRKKHILWSFSIIPLFLFVCLI